MRHRYLITTAAAFLAVVLTAGVWMAVASRIAPGEPGLLVTILGVVFSGAFVWLLITRLRSLLANPGRRLLEMALLTLNLAILIFTFAWVHYQIGLLDMSGPAPRATNDLGDAVYFSIVTSTTLGYGDFAPLGAGRQVAALQALVGYLILGIIVSTGFQLIAPHTNPAETARQRRDRQEHRSEDRADQEGEKT